MFRQIFVNLPVKDMARSQAFFKALGLSFNPRFTNEQGACLEIGENFYAMLLVEPFFQGFTKKPIGDAHKTTEVILALSVDSRAAVEEVMRKAVAAGAYHLHEVTDEFWQRMIAVNLSGVFFMCQAAMPHLLQTKGNIVNMASSAAIVGQVYNAAYCASKGGVNMLTKALAVEFASRGVRVNAVCPGGVNTALTQSFRVPENPDLALFSRLSSLVQPMAEPGEIAGAVAYLASDEARFITGDSLTIDGGQTVS